MLIMYHFIKYEVILRGDWVFKNFIHHVQDKYNNMVEENHHFQQLLQTTTTFHNLFPLPDNDREISDHLITYITNDSPDINEAKAYIIARLIPIDEIYLMVVYARESLTGKEYYLVSTSKKFYVICHDGYLCYPYENLACEVVKSNLMGKTILFSNILLEVNGSEKKLQTFLSILNDFSIREKMIQEKSKYLCGIVPIYQNINSIGSGISIINVVILIFRYMRFY